MHQSLIMNNKLPYRISIATLATLALPLVALAAMRICVATQSAPCGMYPFLSDVSQFFLELQAVWLLIFAPFLPPGTSLSSLYPLMYGLSIGATILYTWFVAPRLDRVLRSHRFLTAVLFVASAGYLLWLYRVMYDSEFFTDTSSYSRTSVSITILGTFLYLMSVVELATLAGSRRSRQ